MKKARWNPSLWSGALAYGTDAAGSAEAPGDTFKLHRLNTCLNESTRFRIISVDQQNQRHQR